MKKAKSLMSIYAHSSATHGLSILNVAEEVYRVLNKLSEVDSIFSHPIHYNEANETPLDLSQNTVEDIGQLILNSEWNEITKHEGVKTPTLQYKRDEDGFSFNAKFSIADQIAFTINIGLGYKVNGISIGDFNKDIEFDYEWYRKIVFKIVELFNPFFATVKLSNAPSNIFYNEMNIKYPIGWITYFSDSYEICIPEDLEEVKYEFVEGGKYLFTSDEDFLKDKEAYFRNREKLKRIINEIKAKVPDFIANTTSPPA